MGRGGGCYVNSLLKTRRVRVLCGGQLQQPLEAQRRQVKQGRSLHWRALAALPRRAAIGTVGATHRPDVEVVG